MLCSQKFNENEHSLELKDGRGFFGGCYIFVVNVQGEAYSSINYHEGINVELNNVF